VGPSWHEVLFAESEFDREFNIITLAVREPLLLRLLLLLFFFSFLFLFCIFCQERNVVSQLTAASSA